MTLPPRQKSVYDYILKYKAKHGYEPSTIVIAKHFKVTYQAIQRNMKYLKEHGYITPRKYEPRGEYVVIPR